MTCAILSENIKRTKTHFNNVITLTAWIVESSLENFDWGLSTLWWCDNVVIVIIRFDKSITSLPNANCHPHRRRSKAKIRRNHNINVILARFLPLLPGMMRNLSRGGPLDNVGIDAHHLKHFYSFKYEYSRIMYLNIYHMFNWNVSRQVLTNYFLPNQYHHKKPKSVFFLNKYVTCTQHDNVTKNSWR